jgi:SecDF, P1 head subdomain
MDDRELEARLRARLHRRFDGAEPPATLRPVLVDVPATSVRALPRSVPIAWLAAAVLIVSVVLVAGFGLGRPSGTGGTPPTATPPPTASPTPRDRQYIVLPPAGSVPSKASTNIAVDTLNLRLHAIGVGNFWSGAGYAITFGLAADVDDALVRAVLSATGELSFVPLPPEEYGPGAQAAVIGRPLPIDEPVLFGLEQIDSSGVATSNDGPTSVQFDLKPIGAAALEVYTSGHVGEMFAVLLDGKVAMLAVVQAAISDGRLELTGGEPSELALLAAIVTSGTLPEEWREPRVPVVISEDEARSLAVGSAASPDAVAVSAELLAHGSPTDPGGLVAAWIVDLSGTLPDRSCTSSPLQSPVPPPCPALSSGQVVLDAVTGEVLESTF